jgi:hypothetical protein
MVSPAGSGEDRRVDTMGSKIEVGVSALIGSEGMEAARGATVRSEGLGEEEGMVGVCEVEHRRIGQVGCFAPRDSSMY